MSFLLNRVEPYLDEPEARSLLAEARENMDRILDDLHNLSVELRPSALDHLGFVPALRSQAAVFERTYGARIVRRLLSATASTARSRRRRTASAKRPS